MSDTKPTTYRDAGVAICSIGVVGFSGDEAAERNDFQSSIGDGE
jgi:hypothetical protein